MKKETYIIFLILLINTQAIAKYKIVTSITPIASLTAMLLNETDADIFSIATSNDCPHHFHANPSHLRAVQAADVNIYINENFDEFAAKLMQKSSSKIIKLGDINKLKIIKDKAGRNWHIWLDLDNARLILKELSKVLIVQFPTLKKTIEINLQNALSQISNLSKIKEQQLSQVSDILVLSDSLEYFFPNIYTIRRLYEPTHKSLKYLDNINKLLLNNSSIKCLILAKNQDAKLYQKYQIPIIQIESENWILEGNLKDLYVNKYKKTIELLTQCKY